MEYAIELKGISKRFGTLFANKNVNLQLKKGEILALLGENGSGKTTLMNMLSGIYIGVVPLIGICHVVTFPSADSRATAR